MSTDYNASVTITYFRTVGDLCFLMHMLMKFRMAFVAPNSRVFGRGELVMDPHEIAMRYLKTDFIIDLTATLPLPQVKFNSSLRIVVSWLFANASDFGKKCRTIFSF